VSPSSSFVGRRRFGRGRGGGGGGGGGKGQWSSYPVAASSSSLPSPPWVYGTSKSFSSAGTAATADDDRDPAGLDHRDGGRHYRVAIVGSGPAGCYTAKYLRSSFARRDKVEEGVDDPAAAAAGTEDDPLPRRRRKDRRPRLTVDVLDRLPTVGGLVRYGVAPDHPEVKNVLNDFEALFESNSGGGDGGDSDEVGKVNFYGNVRVGGGGDGDGDGGSEHRADAASVTVLELRRMYDAVVLACGCESDRKLGIPGEADLDGVLSAREFVAWYNGAFPSLRALERSTRCETKRSCPHFTDRLALSSAFSSSSATTALVLVRVLPNNRTPGFRPHRRESCRRSPCRHG